MKKSIIILIITVIAIVLILSSLVVFAQTESQDSKLEEKVSEEIKYVDNYLTSMLENFNGTSSNILSKNEDYNADWDSIGKQIEVLYQTWNTIVIDLNSLNVEGSYILAFSDYLNEATQNIKNKDKEKAINSISKMYQLLPKYSESYSPNSKETNMLKIKNNVITAYVYVTNEKWEEAQRELSGASGQFTNLLNSVNQDFQNQTTINQCYILTNELNNAIKLKDKEIFFIEYQNLIEKMKMI